MIEAGVLIATKNRKDDLRRTLQSVIRQTVAAETIVFDDGSDDGTAAMVRAEFPTIRLLRDDVSRGYIVRRNELVRLSSARILFSLDDDAEFSSPHVIRQTLADFDDPRIGAVAIPFINVRQDAVVRQRAAGSAAIEILSSYIGTAHAVRRDLFLRLGGYREELVHQGEERDFCVRMLEAGYVVRAGRSDPIHHHESPRRSLRRMDYYGRRNDILFAWHNCPFVNLPTRLLFATLGGTLFGCRVGRPLRMGRGLLAGYAACIRLFRERRPVSHRTFRLYRALQRRGRLPLSEIQSQLFPATSGALIGAMMSEQTP